MKPVKMLIKVGRLCGMVALGQVLLVISESPWPACIIQVILAMAVTIAYNSRNVYLVPFVLLARHSLS